MDVVLIEQLIYYQKCLFSGLELHAIYNWRVMAPNTHCSHFLMHHLLQVVYGCSAYQITALLSKTFFVLYSIA